MTTLSYTEARDNLASAWDQTVSSREPIVFERRGHEPVVLMPLEEWQGVQETAHLLRSPANAKRLLGALRRLRKGKGLTLSTDKLAGKTGLTRSA
jgi:antitoxin YefM